MRLAPRLYLALLAAMVSTGTALAEPADVTLELVAPQGHPGALVTRATLLIGGADGTVVGGFAGYLYATGATARQVFPVSTIPDALRLEFAVPYGGLSSPGPPTTLVFDPFSFPAESFLPNPSPGGEITPPVSGTPADAVIRLSIAAVSGVDDAEAPTCEFTRDGATLEAVVQDTLSGLAEIDVREDWNLVASVPSFTPGTTDPVTVSALVEDVDRSATLLLAITDVASNRRYCKSVTLSGGDGSSPDPEARATGESADNPVPALSPFGAVLLSGVLGAIALHGLRRS